MDPDESHDSERKLPDNTRVDRYALFLAHNRRRLLALQDVLTTQRWKVFCAIPSLLHYNLKSLPGPGDGHEPHGFARPQYAVDTAHHAAEFFPELRGTLPPPRRACFLGLYAMGSIGTACFTSASDIDFWLIHAPNAFPSGDIPWLRRKLTAVEKWAWDKAGLEIHFYIHDLSEIQKGTFSYDLENAGEFGAILKEEFLRTAVHVAGMEPEHWGDGGEGARIDFGPIPHLTPDQYLAACLMQLEKALEKPFKSSLKIALLRRLAACPEDKWPAEILLERIARGGHPDPYMILLEYIWEYLNQIGAPEEHAFLKSVLYLKTIAEESSTERIRRSKDRLIGARFQGIGQAMDLARFDTFFTWPFNERILFSDQIARFIQASLKEISQYIGQRRIDPVKLRSLTRRITLRRGTGTVIENLTFADVPSKGESAITIVKNPDAPIAESWALVLQKFAGRPDYHNLNAIKTGPDAIPLLAFALKNNLVNRERTEVRFHPADLAPRRPNELMDALQRALSGGIAGNSLDLPARPVRHTLVLSQPVANRTETRTVTLLTRTTWGTTEYQSWRGEQALTSALQVIVMQPPAEEGMEAFIDAVTGPDPFELSMGVTVAAGGSRTAAAVCRDTGRWMLIRDRAVTPPLTAVQVLLEIGFRGGQWQFPRLPSDETGQLLGEIMNRSSRTAVSLFRFTAGEAVGFLLVDASGRCDGWTLEKSDADYGQKSVLRYALGFAEGKPIECWQLDYRKDLREPWVFVRLPFDNAPSPTTTDLHIKLMDGGLVAVRFGEHIIERTALQDACGVVAQLIKATRKANRYYPPFLTGITFPQAIQAHIAIPEAVRRKRELEQTIGSMLAAMYTP